MINCQSRIGRFRMLYTHSTTKISRETFSCPPIYCMSKMEVTNEGWFQKIQTTLQGYTNERSHNPSLECLYSKSTSHFVSNHLLVDDYESENGLKDFIYHTLFFSAMKSDESIGMGTRLGHCFMMAECICGSDATTLLTMEHIRPPVVSFFNRRQHLL